MRNDVSKSAAADNKVQKWVSESTYEKVRSEIEQWPSWKKQAYNEMFATSAHAQKIEV